MNFRYVQVSWYLYNWGRGATEWACSWVAGAEIKHIFSHTTAFPAGIPEAGTLSDLKYLPQATCISACIIPSKSLYSKRILFSVASLCYVSPQTATEVTCQTKMCISSISLWHIIHCAVSSSQTPWGQVWVQNQVSERHTQKNVLDALQLKNLSSISPDCWCWFSDMQNMIRCSAASHARFVIFIHSSPVNQSDATETLKHIWVRSCTSSWLHMIMPHTYSTHTHGHIETHRYTSTESRDVFQMTQEVTLLTYTVADEPVPYSNVGSESCPAILIWLFFWYARPVNSN